MILVLHLLAKDQATWSLYKHNDLLDQITITRSELADNFLGSLNQFLLKHKIDLSQVQAFGLLVKEASLTQVKLATATLNTLAWVKQRPIAGSFFYAGTQIEALTQVLKTLDEQQTFVPLLVTYQKPVDITISKKTNKFSLAK